MSPSPRSPQSPRKAVALRAAGSERAVAGLLRDLGAQLQRGSRALAREPAPRLTTGLPEVDALMEGGLRSGCLSEIAGPPSSGRTSLALALLARATCRGEAAAVVDVAGVFDAASARAAGAELGQVLWVRPPGLREAVRCCACLLDARGFGLVLLDLDPEAGRERGPAPPISTWQRLARAAAGSGSALVVLSPTRTTGSFADLALELRAARTHFSGTPALLEGISIEARVTRHRTGPCQRVASVRLKADPRAA